METIVLDKIVEHGYFNERFEKEVDYRVDEPVYENVRKDEIPTNSVLSISSNSNSYDLIIIINRGYGLEYFECFAGASKTTFIERLYRQNNPWDKEIEHIITGTNFIDYQNQLQNESDQLDAELKNATEYLDKLREKQSLIETFTKSEDEKLKDLASKYEELNRLKSWLEQLYNDIVDERKEMQQRKAKHNEEFIASFEDIEAYRDFESRVLGGIKSIPSFGGSINTSRFENMSTSELLSQDQFDPDTYSAVKDELRRRGDDYGYTTWTN